MQGGVKVKNIMNKNIMKDNQENKESIINKDNLNNKPNNAEKKQEKRTKNGYKYNVQNLKPKTSEQNREEAKKNGRKGGIASGVARRRKRDVKEVVERVLAMSPKLSPKARAELKKIGVEDDEDKNVLLLSVVALAGKAMKGDKDALKMLLELSGELENTQNINITTQTPLIINYDYGDEDNEQQEEQQQED